LYEFEGFHGGWVSQFSSSETDFNDPDPDRPNPTPGARNFLYLSGRVDNL
jgi:hypothetical protein